VNVPPELAFFNRLRGRLEIELTEPAHQVAPHILNLQASPSAKIKSLRFAASVPTDDYDVRPLTEDELSSVAFIAPKIELRGDTGTPVVNEAPNGKHFTVRDLIEAVERTELATRGSSEWLGGIDVHHIYFEGILSEGDGTWSICWGS
jgi:hypothetical protein